MESQSMAYRVRNWDRQYETRGSLRHGRPLARLSVSTALDGSVTHRLLSQRVVQHDAVLSTLALLRSAGDVVRIVLVDPNGAWTAGAPEIEITLD